MLEPTSPQTRERYIGFEQGTKQGERERPDTNKPYNNSTL